MLSFILHRDIILMQDILVYFVMWLDERCAAAVCEPCQAGNRAALSMILLGDAVDLSSHMTRYIEIIKEYFLG